MVETLQEDGRRGKVVRVVVHCGVLRYTHTTLTPPPSPNVPLTHTHRKGQYFVAGLSTGRIKAIVDGNKRVVEEAYPGDPVEVMGLEEEKAPSPGDDLFVVSKEKAIQVANLRALSLEHQATGGLWDNALLQSLYGVEEGEGEGESEGESEEDAAEMSVREKLLNYKLSRSNSALTPSQLKNWKKKERRREKKGLTGVKNWKEDIAERIQKAQELRAQMRAREREVNE